MRRRVLLAGLIATPTVARAAETLAWDFSIPAIEGGDLKFAAFKGRVLLVVNTASMCAYAPQYEQLQKLHTTLAKQGLTVIGVPSRDFNQEYSDDAAVKTFCEVSFGIDFPMTTVSHVKGTSAVPFYAWVRAQTGWEPNWNFQKILIGRDGRIKATFTSADEPAASPLRDAVVAALGAR